MEIVPEPGRHKIDIINIILISFFSVRTVSYGSSFFSLRFIARALRAWAINRRGKHSVRNLRYGPRTRLARGVYISTWRRWGLQSRSTVIRNDTESVTLVFSLLYILFKIWGAVQASHYNPAWVNENKKTNIITRKGEIMILARNWFAPDSPCLNKHSFDLASNNSLKDKTFAD